MADKNTGDRRHGASWRDDHALVRDAIKQMLERFDPTLTVETVEQLPGEAGRG